MQLVKDEYTLYITVSLLNTTPLLQVLELDRFLTAKIHCRDSLLRGTFLFRSSFSIKISGYFVV